MDKKSILLGNGFDIQLGGDDYLNKWIITRLIIKAKMGKYDSFFCDEKGDVCITGDEIAQLLYCMTKQVARDVIAHKYDDDVKKYGNDNIIEAARCFQKRYEKNIPTSIEQIGMEDIIFLFQIYLITQSHLIDQYTAAKKGIEWMLLDAIYCEGNIQSLYNSCINNVKVKDYFRGFQNIFTINYDHNLEKITKRKIYHLHGDYDTKTPGMCNIKRYNCSAIFDYIGALKYKMIEDLQIANKVIDKMKSQIDHNPIVREQILDELPEKCRDVLNICIDKNTNLQGDYHFDKLESLSGTLHIVGVCPNNDEHIFKTIEKSNIDEIIFYHYCDSCQASTGEIKLNLPLNKPYIVKNVCELWESLGLKKPKYQNRQLISNKQVELLNSLPFRNKISLQQLESELNSIPAVTKGLLMKLIEIKMNDIKSQSAPKTEKELCQQLYEFGAILSTVSISPQTIYALNFLKTQKKKK